MNDARLVARAGLVVLALLVCAAPALAQRPRPDRAYRGLFGGNGADPNAPQAFDLNASLFGAYDDNVLADAGQATTDPRFQKSGAYTGGSVSLDFTRHRGRVALDSSAGTTYRRFFSTKQLTGFNSFGSLGLGVQFSPRTDFRTSESVSYSPFYSYGAFPGLGPSAPGDVIPISPDYPLFEQHVLSLASASSIERHLTRRSSLSADYLVSYRSYSGGRQPFVTWRAGGKYSHDVTRYASVNLGYHYRRSTSGLYAGGRPIEDHELSVGIDYSRPLSFSRKTTFGFSTGSTIHRSTSPAGAGGADVQYKWHFLVTGDTYLDREIGKSWTAQLTYSRRLQYIDGFSDPLLSNSVAASASGYAGARSHLEFNAAYTSGTVGVGVSGNHHNSYTGAARYQLALVKSVALFVDYTYYHYLFNQTVALPAGMNRGLNRQSVRIGLKFWLPL